MAVHKLIKAVSEGRADNLSAPAEPHFAKSALCGRLEDMIPKADPYPQAIAGAVPVVLQQWFPKQGSVSTHPRRLPWYHEKRDQRMVRLLKAGATLSTVAKTYGLQESSVIRILENRFPDYTGWRK